MMYFTTTDCNSCGKCWEACPTGCIKHPDGVPFSCTTCGVCASVCPTNAIRKNRFGGYYVDRSRCISCGLCIKHCPFGFAKFSEDAARGRHVSGICVRCGICVRVCPKKARVDASMIIRGPIDYGLLMEIATPDKLEKLIEGKPIEVKTEAQK